MYVCVWCRYMCGMCMCMCVCMYVCVYMCVCGECDVCVCICVCVVNVVYVCGVFCVRSGEMGQSVKCLEHKCEDRRSDFQNVH